VLACLFAPRAATQLLMVANQFSPNVERVDEDTVLFAISGLGRLLGDAHAIASAISHSGERLGIVVALAIAYNPATAILAARNLPGVTIIPAGYEPDVLGPLPVDVLDANSEVMATMLRWGVQTVSDLATLPESGIRERLGEHGARLWRLAQGREPGLLKIEPPSPDYSIRQTFDHAVELLEPLLFIISSQLHELTNRLEQHGKAAGGVIVRLDLDGGAVFERTIEIPFATRDPKPLLKQVQLSLESKPPHAPVIAVAVTLQAASPRVIQHGLFARAAPEPDKLQTLLARLGALVGQEHVGSPELLDTHRPDAYRMRQCAFGESLVETEGPSRPLLLALRYFRPPLAARVTVREGTPQHVASSWVTSTVLCAAGPWPMSGDWWNRTPWERVEWDVALENHGVYRIYEASGLWFVEGSYD